MNADIRLPEGVILRDVDVHADHRGQLSEIYRDAWTDSPAFMQWNVVRSLGNVMRGVHVHPRHADYLFVLEGEMHLGLHDLRPDDPRERTSCILVIQGEIPQTVYIPPGVCHGFWFPVPTTHVYGLSTGWSLNEELGCRYNAPELGLNWPDCDPLLSERDRAPEMDYQQMRDAWFENRT